MRSLSTRTSDRPLPVRPPPSRLVRALAALSAVAFVGAVVAIMVVGLLTMTFALLLILPALVLLVAIALVTGRGRLEVRVQRGGARRRDSPRS